MSERIHEYDPADALTSEEAVAAFLTDALEIGDAAFVARAMGVVARARGMTELARETGLSREQLYRTFSGQGNPTLKTMLTVMRALGVDMAVHPHRTSAPRMSG
ncbi:addiction module antidote protein [Halomonas cupida]|uniref:addiction module antidote protein n=1 Tax=Halomonas cupida TaxID=44933 RepID=UPI003A916AF6